MISSGEAGQPPYKGPICPISGLYCITLYDLYRLYRYSPKWRAYSACMQESPIYPQEGTAGLVASRYRSVRKTDAPPSLGKIPKTTIWWPFTLGASAPGRDLSRRNAGHITTCSHGLQSSISDRTLKYRSRAIQYNGKMQQEAAGHSRHGRAK